MIIILAILLFVYTSSISNGIALEMDTIDQLVTDWSNKPWVDIKVTTKPCTGDYEDLFDREWLGLDPHCFKKGSSKVAIITAENEQKVK